MLSAYHGHADLVRLLLRHGADPNRLNDRGQSPLAGVVFKNERECMLALLEGGADPRVGQPTALDATRVIMAPHLLLPLLLPFFFSFFLQNFWVKSIFSFFG